MHDDIPDNRDPSSTPGKRPHLTDGSGELPARTAQPQGIGHDTSVGYNLSPEERRLLTGLLGAQTRLAQIKAEALADHVERSTAELAKLRNENFKITAERHHLDLQHVRERMRMVLEIVLGLLLLPAVIIVSREIWSAVRDTSVVLSPFLVPSEFEKRGNTGVVLASALLDNLQTLQARSRSAQQRRAFKDAWSGEIQIQIPEAKVTVADAQRYLHELLGSQVHVSGSIVDLGRGNISLTVRGTGFAAKTFIGKVTNIPNLIATSAEYIYGECEPYLYVAYLVQLPARKEEMIRFIQSAYSRADDKDKPLLLNAWGVALTNESKFNESVEKYKQAITLNPSLWVAYSNLISDYTNLHQEQKAYDIGTQLERKGHRGSWWLSLTPEAWFARPNPFYYQGLDQFRWDLPAVHKAYVDDMRKFNGEGSTVLQEAPQDAEVLAWMHDQRGSRLELDSSPGLHEDPFVIAQSLEVLGFLAYYRGDYANAAKELKEMNAMVDRSADLQSDFSGVQRCELALFKELAGDPKDVDELIDKGGQLVDCYSYKGDIADHRGHWEDAQMDYRAAIALMPSSPSPTYSWGRALFRHKDIDGSIAKFKDSHALGPHWADPLEAWGEALSAMKEYGGAIERYEEAAKYAPEWGRLYLQWGLALDGLGRHTEAVGEYQKAASLELGEADRVELNRFLH